MKLLYITGRPPYPPLRGDQVVAYYRIRELSARHDITLVTLYEREGDLEALQHMEAYCEDIIAIRLARWQSVLNVVRRCGNGLPFQVSYYESEALRRAIEHFLTAERYDVVHTYLARMAPYGQSGGQARVVELIDSMSRALEGEQDHQFGLRRFLFDIERARIARYERLTTELYDAALVVSEADRDQIGKANVHVIPNGVDTRLFAPPAQPPEGETIMFTGNMGYGPNRRAARWFAESCFPCIKRRHAAAQFVIVGARPPRDIRFLAKRPGVLVRGFVPSVAAALQEATVVVAPMHSGTGVQNKVLEAMATGRAVVVTPLGLGGIHASDGQEVIAATTRETFIDAVTNLLRDRDLVTRLGEAARAYVIAHHSWECSAQRVENVYESILA